MKIDSLEILNPKLVYNVLLDLKKTENFTKFERARIIQAHLTYTGKSQRELSRELGIPHSTIQDWCLWTRIDENIYQELKETGFDDSEIYRSLRRGRNLDKIDIQGKTKEQIELEHINKTLRSYKKKMPETFEIRQLLKEIKNNCNLIEMYWDKK